MALLSELLAAANALRRALGERRMDALRLERVLLAVVEGLPPFVVQLRVRDDDDQERFELRFSSQAGLFVDEMPIAEARERWDAVLEATDRLYGAIEERLETERAKLI